MYVAVKRVQEKKWEKAEIRMLSYKAGQNKEHKWEGGGGGDNKNGGNIHES